MTEGFGVGWPKVRGVGRMFDNDKALLVMLDKKPTDDELRAMHAALRDEPAADCRAKTIITILANTPPDEWLSKTEIHAALLEFRAK
jgi:hypothetical protein